MLKKILNYGVIGVLLLGLVGGTIAILVRPSEAQAERGWERDSSIDADRAVERGQGYGQNRNVKTESHTVVENGDRGGRQGNADGQENGGGQGLGGGQGYAAESIMPGAWETVQGTVVVADSDLTLATADGELLIGLGPNWYREDAGFVLTAGDELVIHGYDEDGEFKAGTVENLTAGTSIILREESGRPMWAGWRGRSD